MLLVLHSGDKLLTNHRHTIDKTPTLGAWAAEGALAKLGPSDGQVFDDFAAEYLDIWQEIGEKWTAAANLQPMLLLPPRLLGLVA